MFKKLLRFNQFEKTTIFAVAISIFVVSNFLISYIPLRLDFSYGKAYTLSKQTRKILSNLDDVVTIKLFISSNLPLALLPLKTDVVDLAKEFERGGKGKVKLVVADPKKNEKAANEARSSGVPELQFSQIEQDKYAVSASYFGIVVSYADKSQVIPQATNLESLEYDIVSSIYKMTQKETVKIGLAGIEAYVPPQRDQFYTLKTALARTFELDYIDASLSASFDKTLKVIVVVNGDNSSFSDIFVKKIADFVNKGGRAIFMIDGVFVGDDLTTHSARHNLFKLLDSYGLTLNRNLVLSTVAEVANFTSGTAGFFTPYPYWLRTAQFSGKSAAFANIAALSFPWVSSVATTKKPGITADVLVTSEQTSWVSGDNVSLLPDAITVPNKANFKKQPLIVEAKKKQGGQIMLIASSRFVREPFLAEGRGNIGFLINVVNGYASGGALSGIRSRTVAIFPLKDIASSSRDIIKFGATLTLPVLLAFYGAARLVRRRSYGHH